MRNYGRRGLLATALAFVLAGMVLAGQALAQNRDRVTLGGSSPAWAKPSAARPAPASRHVSARVYLRPRHKADLDALVRAVSNPTSGSYRHFITPARYRARFAPTASDVRVVRRWLSGAGLRVSGVGAGNRYVAVRGTVAQAERAFGVRMGLFRRGGRTVLAPAGNLSVPAGLSEKVLGVVGLQSPPHTVKPLQSGRAQPPAGFRNARPCSLYYGQLTARYQADYKSQLPKFEGSYRPYAVCGYVPSQLRGAYGVTASGLTGAGATVAITDAYAAPTILQDANRYATRHGDGRFSQGQFRQVLPGQGFRNQKLCDPSGWYGEETLDVEAVHGMATGSKVLYYASRSCTDTDFLDTLARVVDDNKASIVSNSWGDFSSNETSGAIRAYETIFEQAAAQGIGFFFSSGDDGDDVAASGLLQTDYPASDPYVTAVGGTSLAVGAGNNYRWEAGWGTDKYVLSDSGKSWVPQGFIYGAGGGFSSLFNRPDYQQGVVPAGSPAGRAVPDVALDADPTTGMLVGETQKFPDGVYYDEYRIGGTSLASPLMAGMEALASQAQGGRLGFANPRIYDLARSNSKAFRDVTPAHDGAANVRPDYANGVDAQGGIVYSVRTFDDDSSLKTKKGWDDVTGVGSPDRVYFTAGAG